MFLYHPFCTDFPFSLDGSSSVTATIVDRCTGCKNLTSLDLSPTAFQALTQLSVGTMTISWEWDS